jgi:phosphoribosyl 1,2-cyclic phosphate phosphodiesterase
VGLRIEFLGTGGAFPPPRPGCACRVCVEARAKGVPYSRGGPSLFVHGPDILFDTPEEIRDLLVRANIGRVAACFLSHWHPDHVMGRRVFETLNGEWRAWPRRHRSTDVYLPQQVAHDTKRMLGTWDHLAFLESQGLINVRTVRDGEAVVVDGVEVLPFRLAEDYVYAFLLAERGTRILIAMDELHGWTPPGWLRGLRLDVAVLPMGICELDPLTGERRLSPDHPILLEEATFPETLEMVGALDVERVILAHVEEPDGLSHDDLTVLSERLQGEELPVEFAWDTMMVEL